MAAGIAVFFLAACSRKVTEKPYVARVDESVLTEEEFAVLHDSVGEGRAATREFIEQWITNELLYQEALRQGLANTDEMRRQLEAVKKQLAISALLERELFANDTSQVEDTTIAAWYDSSKSAFLLKEDVVRLSFALFGERDAANAFRSKLLRSTSWDDAVIAIQNDSLLRPPLLQAATRQYFTQANLYPEELWKLARTLAREEVSFVVKTDAGYYVLVVHNLQRKGELPDLEYVRNEIKDRILIAQRREHYERLLAHLRATHSVELRIALTDTTASTTE
ncbi:MAG: peptidyl-prolyl cis-trans isomerase [Terriglobia bacterium]